jgi:hypothetical protein
MTEKPPTEDQRMPTDVTPSTLPDSRPLHRIIGSTRRLLRSSWVATGLGITIGLLFGALAVLAVFDLFVPLEPITLPLFDVIVPLDPIMRCIALFLVVVPSALAFLHGVVRPLFRRLGPAQVARRIESHLPGIHNRLVSAIDLEKAAGKQQVSQVFLRRLISEALDRVKSFRPRIILDMVSLRRAAVATLLAVIVSGLAWTFFADRLPTALARIFMPLADIPPASGVAYGVAPGNDNILRNEEITFTADVSRGDPKALRVELYGARGTKPRSFPLVIDRNDGRKWSVVVDGASLGTGFEDGFRYRVYGGRTWSKEYQINLVDRPVIASVSTGVRYPRYMKIPEVQPTPPQAVAVAGPEGGTVEVTVQSQGPVANGEVQLLEPSVTRLPVHKQQERGWFEGKLPTGASQGGTWNWEVHSKKTVHTEPAGFGTTSHWFSGDPAGHGVGTGDVLFAWVYIPEQSIPRTVMLEWHDGEGWEHRAFWGVDNIMEGKPNTASRYHAGALPAAGKWVRLEVPAAKVGLEGKTLKGMGFKVNAGQAFWGRSGTVQVEEPSVRVVASFPMKQVGPDRWMGSFPLVGEGLFRAELKSQFGHPNKPMKEMKYLSLTDKPPYVALEGKSNETTLSRPVKVPLSIAAFDDYGVDEISVLMRDKAGDQYRSRTLWSAGNKPVRNKNLEAELTESSKLKVGGSLLYLIEARDTKGQTARTQEYVVRIAAGGNTADQQLSNFDRTQDTFQEKLVKLLADQKKANATMEKLEKEYAKLSEKLAASQESPQPDDKTKPLDKTGKPEDKNSPKLTPEELKRLAELQKELAKLGLEEDKNAEAARQINEELKKSIAEAGKLELLPKAVVDQMNATQRLFDKMVAKALKDLGKDLKDSSDPKSGKPDVKDLKDKGDRIGKELEGIKDRLDALSKARKDLKDDIKKALADLRDKMAREDGKISARDLEQLKDFINKLREQLKQAKARQDDLSNDTENTNDLKSAKRKQEDLEKELENLLAKAKKLLERKDKDKPEFPDTPFRADDKEEKVPPREEDSDEPLPKKKDKGKDKDDKAGEKNAGEKKDKKDDDDEDEPKFMPRLGGPRQKLDPRYAKKRRPMNKKPKGEKSEQDEKDDLSDRQNEAGKQADAAEKSLESDQNSLDNLLQQLQDAMSGKGKKGKQGDQEGDPESSEAQSVADQLKSLMSSKSMREAMAMAAAARMAGKGQQKGQPQKGPRQPSDNRDEGNLDGGGDPPITDANLSKLDAATRAMIMKMPPSRYREELIRGLNEQGPEAYRAFIQDYFKRLTETKGKK